MMRARRSPRCPFPAPKHQLAAVQQDAGNGGKADGRRTRPAPPRLTHTGCDGSLQTFPLLKAKRPKETRCETSSI